MKRFNSDPYDTQSSILGGNLDNIVRGVASFAAFSDAESDDEELLELEPADIVFDSQFYETATEEDLKKADKLLYDVFGVNMMSLLTKLLLAGRILPVEFVIQSLAYKCQSIVRGISGVRYQKSWGIFWAACRNIIKSRGIVPFRDHFCVPSQTQLVKYKSDAMKLCGLEKASIGRPGLQTHSTELWINSKCKETNGQTLAISASMDGKKIAVSTGTDGTEDMGGIEEYTTKEAVDVEFDELLKKMQKLVKQNDRKSLFTLYDLISSFSQEIVSKLSGLKILEEVNSKRLEKNPNLSKYIYVLKSKALVGQDLMEKLCSIQRDIIELIAEKRKSSHLLPQSQEVNLQTQGNFKCLKLLTTEEDNTNINLINTVVVKNKNLLKVEWPKIVMQLGETYNMSRESKSFKRLVELCYLTSDQTFMACGLGKSRPVQDMKSIYSQSHLFPNTLLPLLRPPEVLNSRIVATFCAIMAPMTFGMNCVIKESGIHIKNGISSIPDLFVFSNDNDLEYTVKSHTSTSNIFEIQLDTVAHCVMDSFLCGSRKGSLALQFNETSLVVINVPSNNNLAENILALFDLYINANSCLVKRSKDIILKQEQIKISLISQKEAVVILGSYPLVKNLDSLDLEEQARRLPSASIATKISAELQKLMLEKRSFLAKQARELVAINISDISGKPSESPHTTLAATFLSSASLKVVGEKCMKEVIEMVEKKNCVCMNIGVDGESLHFATSLPDGTPGTELSLALATLKQLQTFSKESLVKMISKNHLIDIKCRGIEGEEIEEEQDPGIENLEENLEDTLVLIQEGQAVDVNFTLEDIESMLSCDSTSVDHTREQVLKAYKVSQLRLIGLKHIFPQLKKHWMIRNMGQEKIAIFFQDGDKIDFSPSNVFHKTSKGFFRTVTFDFAHIINLFRESAATGKLENMGVRVENLSKLSKIEGFRHLEQIIALKNGKLKFDSMNQKCSSILFSDKTVEGLRLLKDFEGAKAIEVVSLGLLALDESGRNSDSRVKSLLNLNTFLLEKNNILDRLKRPDEKHLTNELFTMTLCSIDSHICTYLNLEFFNPRRKSTGSVEMLFGQLMMMTDGCSKLNARQLQDVLQRVTLSSALRLLPFKVRGFKFLGSLKMHMKSYNPDDFGEPEASVSYPKVKLSDGTVKPRDSCFDRQASKRKQPVKVKTRSEIESSFDGNVRKFHKKF